MAILDAAPGWGEQGQFMVDEANVEVRMVHHQSRFGEEGEEFIGDVCETRFVGQYFPAQAGGFLNSRFQVAFRIDECMEFTPGGNPVDQFDGGDFENAIAVFHQESGGFHIDDDLAYCRRSRRHKAQRQNASAYCSPQE